jgi:hypothetical protein
VSRPSSVVRTAICVLTVVTAVSISTPIAGAGATAVTTNEQFDYVNFIALACANGGENILFSGTFHTVNHLTTDATGGIELTSHFNFQSVQGVGQTSGGRYEWASAGTFHTTFKDPQNAQNAVIRARIIAPGALDNVFQDFLLHVTVTPDGQFVVFRIEDQSGCNG